MCAVAVGGVLGTALRFSIDLALPHTGVSFPWATLIANTTGTLALGLVVGWLWPRANSWFRAGLGSGLLGSFTTFSAIAVSLVTLGAGAYWGTAVGYLTATLTLGAAAAWAGLSLGRRLERRMAGR